MNSTISTGIIKMLLANRSYRLRRFVELRFPQDMIEGQQVLVDEVIVELRNRGVSDEEIQSII